MMSGCERYVGHGGVGGVELDMVCSLVPKAEEEEKEDD